MKVSGYQHFQTFVSSTAGVCTRCRQLNHMSGMLSDNLVRYVLLFSQNDLKRFL